MHCVKAYFKARYLVLQLMPINSYGRYSSSNHTFKFKIHSHLVMLESIPTSIKYGNK